MARQNKRMKDGEWSSSVLQMTCTIKKFPVAVIKENTALRIAVTIFVIKVPFVLSKLTSKNRQAG